MALMRVMQAALDQVTDMAVMGHRLVAAARTMHMACIMAKMVGGHRRAGARVLRTGADFMLVHMVTMGMMQMTIMQIVDMIPMAHSSMAAAWTVDMRMVEMFRVGTVGHFVAPQ